uniref:Uncharacterized protein n=1 Tax=viral metagenome TaxID=1070528 RepID=A0A6C0JWI7_9ZZZZ
MADFINNDEDNFANYGDFVESVGGVFQGSERGSDTGFVDDVPRSGGVASQEDIAAGEDSGPKFEATFKEKEGAQNFGEALNARSAADKPFLQLREAFLNILGEDEGNYKFIDNVITSLRDSKIFPTLNAVYVANAKLFLKENKTYDSKSISNWVNRMNKRFGDKYLDTTDFFRYLQIGKIIFK